MKQKINWLLYKLNWIPYVERIRWRLFVRPALDAFLIKWVGGGGSPHTFTHEEVAEGIRKHGGLPMYVPYDTPPEITLEGLVCRCSKTAGSADCPAHRSAG